MNNSPKEPDVLCLMCRAPMVVDVEGSTRWLVCSQPNCMATINYDSNKRMKRVQVQGADHTEVSKVARDLSSDNDHKSLFRLIANGTFWIGALLAVLGVVLVIVGAGGDTSFSFFGQSFRSQNVGIAAFFLGASLIVLNIRRLLRSIDRAHRR